MSRPRLILTIELMDARTDQYRAHLQANTSVQEPQEIDDSCYYDSIQEAVSESGKELIRIAERFKG